MKIIYEEVVSINILIAYVLSLPEKTFLYLKLFFICLSADAKNVWSRRKIVESSA